MKKWITIILVTLIVMAGIGFYFYKTNTNNNSNNYEAEKTGTNTNDKQLQSNQGKSTEEEKRQSEIQAKKDVPTQKTPTEVEELASFSTKVYSKDSARQNNIAITCKTLNNTDIENGATFSFCNTVGKATSSKGYKEADIYTNGQKTKGYGGGNCQISTTLYNAILKIPSLKVTERHEHSNKVPYIQNGKDAAVAYGSYDFKFVNNTGHSIRIKADSSPNYVSIKLIKLS